MRRSDKEIPLRSEIDAVIRQATVCRLAMADEEGPYIVPLSFGYDGETLYFHSAREGKKLSILRNHPKVCFEFDVEVEASPGETPCKWSMAYRSVIGFGEAEFIESPEARRSALDRIVAQYSDGSSFAYTDAAMSGVSIFQVRIREVSGKRSG